MASSKSLDVLAAIALVAVSAIGLRLRDPEEQQFEVLNGVVGQPVKVNDGEISVTQVRVGTVLRQFGQIQDSTDGMFMAIRVTGAATGARPLELSAARLLTGDIRYEGYQISFGVNAEPGFQTTVDVVFEVASAQIDDLTLEIGSNEIPARLPATGTDQARHHAGQCRAVACGRQRCYRACGGYD